MTREDPLRDLRELFKQRIGLAHMWGEPINASDWRSLVRGYAVGYYDGSADAERAVIRAAVSEMMMPGWWPGPEWAWWDYDQLEETQA